MRYVQAAMSSTQKTPHGHTHTHTRIHTHLQSITEEYSFAPSTSGHPPEVRVGSFMEKQKGSKEDSR